MQIPQSLESPPKPASQSGHRRIYGCSTCKTHFTTADSLISRAYNGQQGRAYLFNGVINVTEGETVDRQMTTGKYTIRAIYCDKCNTTVGWKYVHAEQYSRKYKEGKYILERKCLVHVA